MAYDTFEDFVARGSARLLSAAVLLTGDVHAAEDLTQETLTRMYRAWPSLRSSAAADSYAYRTMVRLARRRERRAVIRREVATDEVPDVAVEPESGGDRNDEIQRKRVDATLLQLPNRQRSTLILRYYVGLGVNETAAVMGCSDGTVKSQTAKGLQALRKLLAVQNDRMVAS